ncbi:MAG: general secretion pathway protein GspK [Luteimonas sp.]|nr:general secretion pathway protein GspK [Luteimonas sp.]
MWLIALLTALVGAFALTARIENLQGRVLSQGVVAEQAARAGLEYAMVRVVDPEPTRQWLPDGRPYQWRFGDAAITVKIVDETAKVDLNAAEEPLLNALFRTVGAEPDLAASVASAIIDWRDPDPLSQPQGGAEDPQYAAAGRPYGAKDAPFDTVAEVEQVLGMTPALYAKVAEHLTVYTGQAQPDQTYASAEVLQAMGVDPTAILQQRSESPLPGQQSLVGSGSGTYSIDSRARLPDGREATLRVVVRAGASGVPGSAYTPLRWEEGASPR